MRSVDHEDEDDGRFGSPELAALCSMLSRKLFSVVEPLLPRGARDEILETFREVTRREVMRHEDRKRAETFELDRAGSPHKTVFDDAGRPAGRREGR
jgi:hypothetical protein